MKISQHASNHIYVEVNSETEKRKMFGWLAWLTITSSWLMSSMKTDFTLQC